MVGTCDPREKSARELAEMMVGDTLHVPSREPSTPGSVVLSMQNLSMASPSEFGTSLRNITLEVRKGEVLGIGGVAGNGQDEFLAALSGESRAQTGDIELAGENITAMQPNERRKRGLLTAPEERLGHSAAPGMSLIENALLTGAIRKNLVEKGFLQWDKAENFARDIIQKFDVRTPSAENTAGSLSGGNLQKFVIGREVLQRPEVLVINQPTWGVDASAAADIRQSLLDLAHNGAAVVVISQDLDELMEVSDRFTALNEGRLAEPVSTQGLDVETIGLMMGGGEKETAA